jgi:hypothetical protein
MSILRPISNAQITQGFGYTGYRANGPFTDNRTGRYYESGFHPGLDLAAPEGTPVYAPEYGVVYTASWEGDDPSPNIGKWAFGGGNVIMIKHNNLPFWTTFAHLSKMYVRTGQPVYRGQLIGAVGQTGNATGPHTHYCCWFKGLWFTANGGYVEDPRRFQAGGDLAGDTRILPTRAQIGAGVNLRTGPNLTARVRSTTFQSNYFPYFETVTGQDLNLYGVRSNQWVRIWSNGWAYVWKPLVRGFTI